MKMSGLGCRVRNVLYGTVSVLVVLGILLGISISARGGSDVAEREKDMFYRNCVSGYGSRIRTYLAEEGFENAGLNITFTTDKECDARNYTVRIHHGRFRFMGEEEKNILETDIREMAFDDDDCGFEVVLD